MKKIKILLMICVILFPLIWVLPIPRRLKDGGNTMIVVTHEMGFAKSVADVVIYMSDGVIEEIGTPDQVFNAPRSEKTLAFLQGAQEQF